VLNENEILLKILVENFVAKLRSAN